MLARSSVFSGGFTLSAAEHVVAADGVDPYDVLDLLDSLVRRSMLVADEHDGVTRYRLLETIRQFGADRLEEAGDVDDTRAAHLKWARQFIAESAAGLRGPDGQPWVARIERELDNWRAATAYAIETSDLDALADLFGSIPTLALYGTRTGNALAVAGVDALATIGEPDHAATAALLALAGYERYLRADYAGADETTRRGCEFVARHPLKAHLPWGFLYAAAYFGQDYETALGAAQDHVRLGHETGDVYTLAEGTGLRAMALATLGRNDEAKAEADDTLALSGTVESPLLSLHTNFMVGFTYTIIGEDPTFARSCLEAAAMLATAFENPFFATSALGMIAATITDVDVDRDAAAQLRAALELLRSLPQREVARDQLELVASVLVRADRHRGAAMIYGAAIIHNINPASQAPARDNQLLLEAELGQDAFDDCTRQGRDLTVDEALAFAIAELDAIIAGDD